MNIDDLLAQVRERRLILQGNAALWSPNTYTPQVTQRAVKQHRTALLRLISQADIRVCPSQNWHKAYWRYAGNQRYVCEICARLSYLAA